MKVEEWIVAYRKREKETLIIDNTKDGFAVIKNTWRYWCADPYLFNYNGHHYVFAELYDRILRRGVIGCCEINDVGYMPWKVVLKTPYHLSYPNVFAYKSKIYMIPESYVAEEIAVFEAIDFPYSWKKAFVLMKNYISVDSTCFATADGNWMLTNHFECEKTELVLFSISDNGDMKIVTTIPDDNNIRPAGNVFYYDNQLLRPAQDCSTSYGCALNFYEITEIGSNTYAENLIMKIKPEEIKSDLRDTPKGIHTYNFDDAYEIIDLKMYRFDIWAYLMKPIWFIWRRVKKILL